MTDSGSEALGLKLQYFKNWKHYFDQLKLNQSKTAVPDAIV